MLHGGPLPGKGLSVTEDICESVAQLLCTAAANEIFIQLPVNKVKDPCPAFLPISQKTFVHGQRQDLGRKGNWTPTSQFTKVTLKKDELLERIHGKLEPALLNHGGGK